MKNKLAFYNPPFPNIDTYYKLIDCAVKFGVNSVEGFNHLELVEPDLKASKEIRRYADKKGISFCCFSVYANIVGEDSKEQIERIKRFTDVAKILGSPFIHHTIAPEFHPWKHSEQEAEDVFLLGINGVREIYDYAIKNNVLAVYEDQAFIFNGVENFSRFVKEVKRDIGIVADFGNIYQMDERIGPFIEKFKEKIVHIHLKDMLLVDEGYMGCYSTKKGDFVAETEIGTGTVDFEDAFGLLKQFGYDGYFAIEYMAKEENCHSIDRTIKKIKSFL